MKRNGLAWLSVAVVAGLLGCVPEKRVMWSPDGEWAAVRAGDGFYMCDGRGQLSPRLADNIAAASWLPDSRRLVLSSATAVKTWDELTKQIPVDQVRELQALGEKLHAEALAYDGDWNDFKPASLETQTGGTAAAVLLYLRDHASPALREKLGDKWDDTEKIAGNLNRLQLAEWRDGALKLGAVLVTSLDAITEPRVSPDGKSVAYMLPMPGDNAPLRLHVAAMTGATAPRLVAERSSMFADWSADGRFLVYAAANPGSADADAMRLGVVARRQVCSDKGEWLDQLPDAQDLAGIVFQSETRVRCLRDGRVVFATAEIQLPCTTKDMPQRTTLFALDPDRQATVTRLIPRQAENDLPDAVFLFEVSPDELRVSLPNRNGEVRVLTLATGDLWQLHGDGEADELRTVPVWRSSDELCYSFGPPADQPDAHADIVLDKLDWEKRETNRRVLSAAWPASMRPGFLEKKPEESPAEPTP